MNCKSMNAGLLEMSFFEGRTSLRCSEPKRSESAAPKIYDRLKIRSGGSGKSAKNNPWTGPNFTLSLLSKVLI